MGAPGLDSGILGPFGRSWGGFWFPGATWGLLGWLLNELLAHPGQILPSRRLLGWILASQRLLGWILASQRLHSEIVRLLQVTSQGCQKCSFYKENQQLCFEFFPRAAVESPSAALLWEAQMLCWLAFGDHEALTSDISRWPKMVLLQGKPTTVPQIFPTGSHGITLRGPPPGGPNALLASI